MVDLIVSLALASAAVASSGVLATTASRVNTEAGRRSQATSLADREMEALRDFRNTEENAGTDWNNIWTGFTPDSNPGVCVTGYMQRQAQPSPTPAPNGQPTWRAWKFVPAGSLTAYTAANAGEASGSLFDTEYNSFSRSIKICDVSSQLSTTHTASVTVTEQWREANGQRQVVERTLLSDWSE